MQSWDHSKPISVKESHKNEHIFRGKNNIHVLGFEEIKVTSFKN